MQWTLTEGLGALGGAILLALVGHGWWQARKAGPRQARPTDAGGRHEPRLGGDSHPASLPAEDDPLIDAVSGLPESATDEPGSAGTPLTAESRRPLGPRKTARLDPLIDAIAPMSLESPVSGDLALAHLPASRRAGSKPFLIEGLNARTHQWELPVPGQRYGAFQGGVQMANRAGALNEIEYSEFVQKLQGFADAIGAMADLPDMLEVVRRARELDAFAGAHDAQLSIGLRANAAAWTLGFLQQTTGRHGFLPGAMPGRLVLPAAEEGTPPVLVLSFDAQAALAEDPSQASVREVQLTLDVPQTPEVAEPYPAWQDIARRLAADLDAALIDGSGRPILLQSFVSIGEDLARLYTVLAERELPAGSPAARRLFS
ncbi:MAG: hypothetical protein RIQ53_131 [Pseudomonadota bacterium]